MIELILGGTAAAFGYSGARDFVTRRLRYVDRVRSPLAPFVSGSIAALAAAPVVAVMPWVGGVVALVFGAAVGTGTYAGVRRLERTRRD